MTTAAKKAAELPTGAKLTYTVDETARALGLSAATIWAMLKDGELSALRIRGRTLIRRDEIERVIDAAPNARAA